MYVAGQVWSAKCQDVSLTHAVYSATLLLIGQLAFTGALMYMRLIGLHACREIGLTHTEAVWRLSFLPVPSPIYNLHALCEGRNIAPMN